jgi:hypothetical protein
MKYLTICLITTKHLINEGMNVSFYSGKQALSSCFDKSTMKPRT